MLMLIKLRLRIRNKYDRVGCKRACAIQRTKPFDCFNLNKTLH